MSGARLLDCDVLVAGGGAAGVAAALAAAHSGARTVLAERYGFLGGAATNAQVFAYCGFHTFAERPVQVVRGMGAEVLREVAALGVPTAPVRARSGAWIVQLDPEATKHALDRLVERAGVQVLLHTQAMSVTREADGRIGAVTLADPRGLREVRARAVVEATGHASLAAAAGLPRAAAQEGRALQPCSLPMRLSGIAPGAEVDRARLAELIAAFNAGGGPRIARADGGVLMRMPLGDDHWWMVVDLLIEDVSGEALARAEMQARAMAWTFLPVIRGLPGFDRATLAATGPQLGIRESPRPAARREVTEADALAGRRDPGGIARAAWPMEMHEAPGRVRWVPLGGEGFFDVPLDALRPPGCDNLWLAGRTIGADARAYASTRVMGTAFATGHAAGVAAALQAGGAAPEPGTVRAVLAAQDALA